MSEKLYAVVPDFGKIDMFARDRNEEVAYFKFKDQAMAFANKMWPGCHEIKEVLGDFTRPEPIREEVTVYLYHIEGEKLVSTCNLLLKPDEKLLASSKVTLVEGEYV